MNRIAPTAKRKRAEFIRRAVKDAIFQLETDRMREAYRLQPDSVEASGIWELPGGIEIGELIGENPHCEGGN